MFSIFANQVDSQGLGLDPTFYIGTVLHFFEMDVARIVVLLVGVIDVMGLQYALLARTSAPVVRGLHDWDRSNTHDTSRRLNFWAIRQRPEIDEKDALLLKAAQ